MVATMVRMRGAVTAGGSRQKQQRLHMVMVTMKTVVAMMLMDTVLMMPLTITAARADNNNKIWEVVARTAAIFRVMVTTRVMVATMARTRGAVRARAAAGESNNNCTW